MDIRLKELLLRCFFIRKWSCDSFDISVISKEILIKDNRASVRIFVFLLRFECHTKIIYRIDVTHRSLSQLVCENLFV